jgi:acyl-homoserine-lactone acylase
VPTTVAVTWAEELVRRSAADAMRAGIPVYTYIESGVTAGQRLQALAASVEQLTRDFGTWMMPWGDINRFQRISPTIAPVFDDAAPSIPVGFPSARWGSLASFAARPYPPTKKWYGTTGNSFLAIVEFGDRVRAKAVTAGGESGDPHSRHFNDQAVRYATGNLRDVYFYPEDLRTHVERRYHPGE